ncbi:imm11 family protein [Clostridium botulinum]|uniref:imm11 family protein n=1 Tax=Clostridium botulinum TaxID=1491 RepID=UPI00389AD0C8
MVPLSYDKGDYSVINVTNVKDCVDYEKAEVKRFKGSDKIFRFIKYAFKPESIKNEHIFKVCEYSKIFVFVSDEFKNLVESSGLKGFLFIEVWDSEKDF